MSNEEKCNVTKEDAWNCEQCVACEVCVYTFESEVN